MKDFYKIRSTKHLCIYCYFEAMSDREDTLGDTSIIISRNCISQNDLASTFREIKKNSSPLVNFEVCTEGGIGDRGNSLEMDFANEYIGGGVLTNGNVQEEIMFTIRPECLVSLLLCEKMKMNESIAIIGTELFNKHSGYGGSFRWVSLHEDDRSSYQRGDTQVKDNVIVAIDALYLGNFRGHMTWELMQREMCKAYVGFSWTNEFIGKNLPAIETGNWGCGMFGGHPIRKAMIQWISASVAPDPRTIVYYNFDDPRTRRLAELTQAISDANITAGQLAGVLQRMVNDGTRNQDILRFLMENLNLDFGHYFIEF